MTSRSQRFFARSAVWIPAALLGPAAALLATWLRVFDPDTLQTMAETGVDLRIGALAFGLIGAFGASHAPGPASRPRRFLTALSVIGALVGACLIVVGLVGALLRW